MGRMAKANPWSGPPPRFQNYTRYVVSSDGTWQRSGTAPWRHGSQPLQAGGHDEAVPQIRGVGGQVSLGCRAEGPAARADLRDEHRNLRVSSRQQPQVATGSLQR